MLKSYLLIKIKLLIILLSCIVFIGCGNDDSKTSLPPPTPTPITPTPPPTRICDAITTTNSGASNPLCSQQWYLQNTGQNAYAESGGNIGVDLNLTGVTQTGKGVVVNVVDSGMEIAHEDLNDRVIVGSINFGGGTDPTNTDSSGDHGTSVAGIIAASSNNLGGRGVAPEASLIAYNFLKHLGQANDIRAILATADINNQSYGRPSVSDFRINGVIVGAYREGVSSGRNGKGKIYVKAAGNGFNNFPDSISIECSYATSDGIPLDLSKDFTQSPISCENANIDPNNTLPYNIVVAAMNASGIKASYSTTGSAILISGFGGEFGNKKPAMITTNQSGCNKGYLHFIGNDFNRGIIPNVNQNCNYTNIFSGTSSATPTVAGVIALMLEANPTLSWRDVRHILVSTSKKVDASRDAIKTKPSINNIISDATADLGWIRNAAGLEFHNWYGFGLVDANAAVTMAQNYTSPLGDFKIITATNDSSSNIPDKDFTGATSVINFTDDITIESIQIDIQITHPVTASLGIWLKSPSGTKSILLTPFNNFAVYYINTRENRFNQDLDMVLASQAFYGEVARGDWELKVIDYIADNTGDLENWKLIIYGH